MKNKIIAIVPIRGGSKSIPLKGIVPINGKPLAWYTFNELLKVKGIDRIALSSDSQKIKDTIRGMFGKKVGIIDRPKSICGDLATSESAMEHAIKVIHPSYTHILFAQCTSPLTLASDFSNLIKELDKKFDSVAFYTENYDFFFDIKDDYIKIIQSRQPRQTKTPRKNEAGNAWLFSIDGFKKTKSRLFGNIGLVKIDHPRQLEIDEPNDLPLMECLLKQGNY